MIERVARVAVFQHPPSRIVWRNIAVGTDPRLQFYPAIKPAVWDKIGSPIVFKIHVVAADARTVVFEETLNPRERASDRKWSQRSVDLSSWSDRTIDLELSTTSPTGGGVAFGWSGWGDLRLEHTTPTSNVAARRLQAGRSAEPTPRDLRCNASRSSRLLRRDLHLDPQYRSPRPGRPSVRACPRPDRNDVRIILLVAHRRSSDPNRCLRRMGPTAGEPANAAASISLALDTAPSWRPANGSSPTSGPVFEAHLQKRFPSRQSSPIEQHHGAAAVASLGGSTRETVVCLDAPVRTASTADAGPVCSSEEV